MLTYNTQRKKLALPEYGRNIQKMVDYCGTLETREKRNACARSIVKVLASLFPQPKDGTSQGENKYWDILAIISNFELDIDWPGGTVDRARLAERPEPVPMTQGPMRFNIYGKNVQRMMEYAMDLPGGDEKDDIIMMLANQMKKQLASLSPDNAEDARVFKDIATMTNGEIRMNPEIHRLNDYKVIQPVQKKKKKK